MASYKIHLSESVHKDFRQIPQKDINKILARIDSLAIEQRPYGCKQLAGQENYQVRQVNYRIIYSIRDTILIILILKIGHRKDIYR